MDYLQAHEYLTRDRDTSDPQGGVGQGLMGSSSHSTQF